MKDNKNVTIIASYSLTPYQVQWIDSEAAKLNLSASSWLRMMVTKMQQEQQIMHQSNAKYPACNSQ